MRELKLRHFSKLFKLIASKDRDKLDLWVPGPDTSAHPRGSVPPSAWTLDMHLVEEALAATQEEAEGECQWKLKGRNDIWAGYGRVNTSLLGRQAYENKERN